MTSKVADKDYYLDVDGNVVEDGESAHTLLVREGQEMSQEVAEKVGSQPADSGKVARQTDTAAVEEEGAAPDAEKAAAPKANKSAKPTKNKGVK